MSGHVVKNYRYFTLKDAAGRKVRLEAAFFIGKDYGSGDWLQNHYDRHIYTGSISVNEGAFFLDKQGDRMLFTYEDDYDFIGIWLFTYSKNSQTTYDKYPGVGYIHPDWVWGDGFLPGLFRWESVSQGML